MVTDDPVIYAKIQQWLSIASGLIATGPARARLITVFGANFNAKQAINDSQYLVKIMETELGKNNYLVGNNPTLADVAAYSYIAHAPKGNVSLLPYPNIGNWLRRIEVLDGFIDMPASDVLDKSLEI